MPAVTRLKVDGNTVAIDAPPGRARVVFLDHDVVRTWVAREGRFSDPANTKPLPGEPGAVIVVKDDYPGVVPEGIDVGGDWGLATPSVAGRGGVPRTRG